MTSADHHRSTPVPSRELCIVLESACAFLDLGTERDLSLEACTEGQPDWERVRALAVDHHLERILYHELRNHHEAVPQAVLEDLKERSRRGSIESLHQTKVLGELVDLFRTEGIDYLVLKGIPLAEHAYGEATVRPSVDIDLLIAPEDLDGATDAMDQAGFRVISEEEYGGVIPSHHRILVGSDVTIDLHWKLSPTSVSWGRDVELLLEDKRLQRMNGMEVPTLGIPDELVYLSHHGAYNQWYRAKWLLDLVCSLKLAGPEDEREALDISRDLGSETLVSAAFQLCRSVSGEDGERSEVDLDSEAPDIVRLEKHLFTSMERGFLWWLSPVKMWNVERFYRRHTRGTPGGLGSMPWGNRSDIRTRDMPTAVRLLHGAIQPIRLAGSYVTGRLRTLLVDPGDA